ncbi:MAG TPA: MAE_28990/MAE_18760 family HEPN-like nuclease [Nocardioidaceae bacterium]|nr:MAE_28990/MAE_18760 family HEPN-like nuclease [Nocardioidaceae bacterium]
MPTLVEKLVDDLDGDLSKRRREILDLRLMVAASSGARLDLITRSCHVMAYAHWEGFVKFSLRAYLDHLVDRRLTVGALNYRLQSLTVKSEMRFASEPDRSVERIASLLVDLDSRATQPFLVTAADVVKTGNMTSDTLRTLLGCAGLDYLSAYETRENFIDSVVCGRRHRIAHGDWQPISRNEAREVAEDVLELCDELNQQVQTAALYELYRL